MRIEEIIMVLCAKSDAALSRATKTALGTRNAHALEVFARESETVNVPGAVDVHGAYARVDDPDHKPPRRKYVRGPDPLWVGEGPPERVALYAVLPPDAVRLAERIGTAASTTPCERAIPYRDQSTTAKYENMFAQPPNRSPARVHVSNPDYDAIARDQTVTPSNAPVFFLRTGSGEVVGEIIGDPDYAGEGPPPPVRFPTLFERVNDARSRCRRNWTIWMVATRYRKVDGADQVVLTSDKARNMKQGIKGMASRVLSHRVACGKEIVRVY